MERKTECPKSLYLHVPFCKTICAYCDFTHQIYRDAMAERWLDALGVELQAKALSTSLKTIYIGGGTPTALKDAQFDRLLSYLDPYSKHVQEYTVEVNPETVTYEKVSLLKQHGVNRISMGFQSSDAEQLKQMNRHHTLSEVQNAVALFRQAGITNLSLDLMYSLPNQTMEQLQQSVADARSLNPTHLSLYSLTIEEHSVFGKRGYQSLDEDLEADMYEWIAKDLEQHGYQQYEISNYCFPGYESQHNCAYWNYENFYGISIGASGKESGFRYDNTRSMKEYLQDPLKRTIIPLTKKDEMFEMVMMGLRLKKGLSLQRFQDYFGISLHEVYAGPYGKQVQLGNLVEEGDRLKATSSGYEILNTVLEDFLPES